MTKPSRVRNKGRRQKAERSGRSAETVAAMFLRLQGFSIAGTRVKTPVGELDLVARRGSLTVFVEVKARTSGAAELATLEAVNRQRITRAAQYYLALHPEISAGDLRFDVIFLAPWRWPRHVRNAFEAS